MTWHPDTPNTRRAPPAPDTTRVEYERRQAEEAWQRAQACPTPDTARPWLERAHRFAPSDQNLAFALATARLATGDADAALGLFTRIAARQAGREILAGIAACALTLGRADEARRAIGRALSSTVPDAVLAMLATRVAGTAWCGLTLDGELQGGAGAGDAVLLDGRPVQPDRGMLPLDWRGARVLRVTRQGRDVLGSPIDLVALRRTEGFAALTKGGVEGWAWHPADPDRAPRLTVLQDGAARTCLATDLSVSFRGTVALSRPRGFSLAAGTAAPVRVLGDDGRDLWGSPLGGPARAPRAPPATRPGAGVAVIVPVYRGHDVTLACLRAVLATIGATDRLIVVDDASPEPDLAAALGALASDGRVTLIPSNPAAPGRNMGFPEAANAGLRAAAGADTVLLNSDTLVTPGWLATLRDAVHSAPDIGTATPLSNDATIFSYPDPENPAPMPDGAGAAALAALAMAANRGILVDVPTGHGFCLYIRAACLHGTGLLRAALFAQGYGEENDFCERARRRGWRHVAVPSVYVGHVGGTSFGPARHHLLARNGAILDRLHPGYRPRVAAFIAADPLLPARARLDEARLLARAGAPCVLLVSHGGQGGTARIVRERAAALRRQGAWPILLRGHDGFTDAGDDAGDTPNLRYDLPDEAACLLALLRRLRPVRAEIHHLSGHGLALADMLRDLAIPYDLWVHDYFWLCARLTLVTGDGRFCGEPPVAACNACVAQWGDGMEVPMSPAALRARSAWLLPGAASVVVPSADVGRRIARHFPAAAITELAWEADPPGRPARRLPEGGDMLTVAVVGALGMEKGYHLLVDCARDAAARGLKLRFAVAGYTIDDAPLLATGRAFVTGPFKPEAAAAVIGGLGAQLAFLPSIWPETWCFALSDIWLAGLDAAVFDIGTPAERVRQTGRGWVLPLGLPAARVNDVLLNLQGAASRS